MAESYLTIESRVEALYKEKGSRFLAFAIPVFDLEQIKQELAALKKEYYDATHHCYAYVLGFSGETFRANDDGEPSSTAGKPIHGQIVSRNLTNTLVVVVRYFGGTKLGVGGLIKAYKASAELCLDAAKVVEKKVRRLYKITFAYEKMNAVMSLAKRFCAEQKNHSFDTECSMEILLSKQYEKDFEDVISKQENVEISFLGEQ